MIINQLNLVTAILTEISRQCKARKVPDEAPVHLCNAVIEAANLIVAQAARKPIMAREDMGLENWLASDDTGMSSKAMAHHLLGAACKEDIRLAHPHDPADFGRCHRFLQAVPEAVPLLPLMANVSPVWARLIAAWPELTALYLEELPFGKCPRLYETMKNLCVNP